MNFFVRVAVGGMHGTGASSWTHNLPISESWRLNRRWSRMLLSKHYSRWQTRTRRSTWNDRRDSRWNMLASPQWNDTMFGVRIR
jgi:hypothetical protein